jgi:hypothetical protein
MSTPCAILVKTNLGYITSYCHFDGYIDYMYPMLTNNYNSYEKAIALVRLGDASYIADKLEPTTDTHSFEHPERGVSVFYHRDRGESWLHTAPKYCEKETRLSQFQYGYVFENDCWNVYKLGKEVERSKLC